MMINTSSHTLPVCYGSRPFSRQMSSRLAKMLILIAGVFAAASTSHARTYNLWAGLATFERPADATITKQSSKEYFVAPGPRGRQPVLAVISRHQLSRVERAASLRQLGLARKRNFEAEGGRVTSFKVNQRQQRVSMDVAATISKSDAVPLAFAGQRTKIRARFIAYRRGGEVVQAIVLSEQKTWNQRRTISYRNAFDKMRARR